MDKQGLILLSVADELATPHAIGPEQGRRLHGAIEGRLETLADGGALWLSFLNVRHVDQAFLEEAVGAFHEQGKAVYGDSVFATDMALDDLLLLERVVDDGDAVFAADTALDDLAVNDLLLSAGLEAQAGSAAAGCPVATA